MKKIEAIIRPEKVGPVREALEKLNFSGLTIIQVDGHGKQRGTVQKFRGQEHRVGILPKTKIEIVADDEEIRSIVDVIVGASRSGEIGDGKIFIYPVEDIVRIRTGETGLKAL